MIEPDRKQIEDFVQAIFRHAGTQGFISIRSFGPDNKPLPIGAVALAEGLDALVAVAVNAARIAANHPLPAVFCPPLAVLNNRYTARAEDVLRGLVLSAECDVKPSLARYHLEILLGPATVAVESGGECIDPVEPKLHLHWRLKQPTVTPEGHALLLSCRQQMAFLVAADPTNAPIAHPIRWPGSWHRKATPRLTKIIAVSENEIDLNETATKFNTLISSNQPRSNQQLVASNQDEVAEILDYIGNPGDLGRGLPDYDARRGFYFWRGVCLATFAASEGSEAGRIAFHKWSAKSTRYDARNTEQKWRSCHRSPPKHKGHGSLKYLAWQHFLVTGKPMPWWLPQEVESMPDWMQEEVQRDKGKGVSTSLKDNRLGGRS